MSMTTFISKTTPPFGHEWQMVSILNRHLIITRWASIPILNIIIVEVIVIILGCLGRRKGDSTKPPRWACRLAIQLTRVFTWHNSSLRMSRRASMRWSCAMIASRVTPPKEEERAEVDRAEEVGGAAVCVWGYCDLRCASLHRTVAASMAPITEKWGETGKGTEKWWRIRVIAEGKMSFSQVVISL